MPNFDRSGPQGAGPMTGRGLGRCHRRRGGRTAADAGPVAGRGRRRGGRGLGPRFYAIDPEAEIPSTNIDETMTPEARRLLLKGERNRLKARLSEVEGTLKAIGREPAGDDEA